MMSSERRLPAWLKLPALPATWRTRARPYTHAATQKWRRLSAREQRLMVLLSVLVATALIYLVGVQPAWRTIERHASELPVLRAQAARVDALVQESLALRGQRTASIAPQSLQGEIAASLSRAALGGEHTVKALAANAGPAWEISLSNVAAGALFDWMGHAPSQLRLTISEAHLNRALNPAGKPLAGKASGTLIVNGVAP